MVNSSSSSAIRSKHQDEPKKNSSKYDSKSIESKWQRQWIKTKIFQPDIRQAKNPFYNLMMFPYPSAEGLHVGNMYAFTGADIYGRFKRMQGFDVFEPIGLDGFGIHSENFALKIGEHPAQLAKKTEENFYRQLHATGNAYAWDNTLETYDPDYYRFTQWIFIQMYKKGLAYRARVAVNWCPNCKTTLADEQVICGACERCKAIIEKRELDQWFFKITDYADKLLENLKIIDWSEKVKIAQRNWIGKSEGLVEFWQVEDLPFKLETFTTWPHTTWGATFIVMAPQHPLIKKLISGTSLEKQVEDFCQEVIKENKGNPLAAAREKKGFFTGRYAINHLTGERMKIFIANFAVMEYGTGVVKCCPAHDQKDFEFAKKYGLEIRPVIVPEGGKPLDSKIMVEAYAGEGTMINAKQFDGMLTSRAREEITKLIIKSGNGRRETQYHLRDWCVSRQRYWGPPIPMVYCQKCGWQPVPEDQLPILLPDVSDWRPKGTGRSPLANIPEFIKTKCPKCGSPAERETDVSDTFLDSAWYFLRYPSIGREKENSRHSVLPWDPEITKKWLPVNMYIGGAEHSVLHLMYSRFLTMVFKDMGLLNFEEPFSKFYAHGLLISEGAKMSKSRGNVIIPDEYIKAYGADTVRCYLMFLGPFDQGGDFRDTGIAGMWRFLNRVWKLVDSAAKKKIKRGENQDKIKELKRISQRTIKEVTEDMENLRYNTALAQIMEYVNYLKEVSTREAIEILVLLLSPFAPHLSEELWCNVLGNSYSVHQQSWPKYNEKLLEEDETTLVIEINGRIKDKLTVPSTQKEDRGLIEKLVMEREKVKKILVGREVRQVIFIPGKLINFVV